MKGLYKYLDKIGADYEKQFYGDNYFENAAPVIIPAAVLHFRYQDQAGAIIKKKIQTYCKRYNYVIFYEWHNWNGYGFTITTPELYKAHSTYQKHVKNSVTEWEEMQHEYLTTGRADEINEKTREIMRRHEKEYLKEIA